MILKTSKYNIEVYDGIPYRLFKEFKRIVYTVTGKEVSEVVLGVKVYAKLEKIDWFNRLIKKITDKDGKELDISVLEEVENEKDIDKLEKYFSDAMDKAGALLPGESKKKE